MATLQNTTIDDTSNLSLPAGSTEQRPVSPAAGMIRYNTTLSTTEYYDGLAWRSISDTGVEATGGTIVDTEIGGVAYRLHYFTNTGNTTFTVTKGGEVEYLIVAGGGGGGNHGGGGGGAGGLLTGTTTVTAQAYTITVGAGGTGDTISYSGSQNGDNSSFAGLTAIGGGRGIHGGAGVSGGSGGGGSYGYVGAPVGGGGAGGTATAGQGNAGGIGSGITGSYPAGGGGGAGSVGQNATDTAGGNGGQGLAVSITGALTFYAGGGGGGTRGGVHGLGGLGGGANSPDFNAAPNTGGGGSNTTYTATTITNRGVGGSGIVIVRYRRNASTATNPDRIETSTLPLIATNKLENLLVSRTGLVTYVDAGNPASYPGSGTTLTDLSGNGSTGNFVSSPIFKNEFGGIINLDGGADYIYFDNTSDRFGWTPSSAINNSISIEIWLRAIDTESMFLSRPWNGSGQYNYYITNGGFYASCEQGASVAFTGFTLNKWEYICAVLTPTQIGVYRNGVINAAFVNHNITSNSPSSGNAGLPLTWGTLYPYGGGGNSSFSPHQDVAILRVYNRILSAGEVNAHYRSERARFSV